MRGGAQPADLSYLISGLMQDDNWHSGRGCTPNWAVGEKATYFSKTAMNSPGRGAAYVQQEASAHGAMHTHANQMPWAIENTEPAALR